MEILTAEQTEPEWLIPDLLLQGSLVAIAGEPGTGKSYLTYTIGLAIAAGCEALSGLVPAGTPRRVIYFDQENGRQDRNRYLLQSYYGLMRGGTVPNLDSLGANFYPCHFGLGQDDWYEVAAAYVEALQPHLIVFDTSTPCMNIENENDNGEATRAINRLREVMALADPVASAVVLKHAKMKTEKGGRRTIRGGKSW